MIEKNRSPPLSGGTSTEAIEPTILFQNGYLSGGRGGLVHQGGGYCPEKSDCNKSAAAEERPPNSKIT